MSENSRIREAVEAVVAETLDAHVRTLHDEIVARVIERVEPHLGVGKQASHSLKAAMDAIEAGAQQTEILAALLDNAALFARRAALFVQRGTIAVAWQARGFEDPEALKALTVDATTGLAGSAIQQRQTAIGPVGSFDYKMAAGFGIPRGADCAIMPLIIRDRVAALLYAEGAREGSAAPDVAAIEILVRTAGLWIELQALRKASGTPPAQPRPVAEAATGTAAAAISTPAMSSHAAARAGTPREHDQEVRSSQLGGGAYPEPAVSRGTSVEASVGVSAAGDRRIENSTQHGTNHMEHSAVAPSESAPAIAAPNAHEYDELHKKARRFAKLLVDEIVLYNRAKVEEGRARRDLYDRLKDDIDKSRATFDRRYAETNVASQDYFTQALINGLAQQNPELLGPNFAHAGRV